MDTTETVFDGEDFPFRLGCKLKDAIAWLEEKLSEVPPEYRNDAVCGVEEDTKYDSTYVNLVISYDRPETASERGERLAKEEARIARYRAGEIAELQALRKKYPEET